MFMIEAKKLVLLVVTVSLLGSACAARETPLRDRIREMREARKEKRADRVADHGDERSDLAETITIAHDGLDREVLVRFPAKSAKSVPLVIVLHGGMRGPDDVFSRMSWPDIAKREGFILAAPKGIDKQWNDGRGTTVTGKALTADDTGFIATLIAKLVRDSGADPRAVFITGVSNGGLMSMRFACERTTTLAAVAPVISTLPENLVPICSSAPALPALFMAGTADPIMTYDGKPSALTARRGPQPPMLSMPATLDLWRSRNGCADKGTVRDLANPAKRDQSTVTYIEYLPCKSGAPVVHYRINGGGHQMPSLELQELSSQFQKLLGPQNNDIDGPAEIWRFFASQMKR
jgi:polyhydroxybutyrate depolymerase